MKFIIKTFGFLVTLVVFAAAYWFLLEPADREELFENTVTKVTGKSFDETFYSNDKNQMSSTTLDKEKKIKFWVAPMDANYRRDEPGKSPMGMDLVPVYEEALIEEKPAMTMDDVKDDDLLTHARRHSDPTYVCPMHPQIVKGEPGNCPICGMNLVEKEVVKEEPAMAMSDTKKETVVEKKPAMTMDDVKDDDLLTHARRHSDPTYVCPMHPQIVKGEPGNCPICGMNLVKKETVVEEEPMLAKSSKPKEKKIKFWVAPMDANYRRDEPGKSPMGMDLVPVYEEASEDMGMQDSRGMPKITINPSTAQNMGVRIEKAAINELSRTITTLGSITYNEDSLHHIHARASGWIEKLYTSSLGDPVTKGETLLEYYSPDIVAAQKDLILAKRSGSNLTLASKTRLRDLNVSDEFIEQISKTGKSQNRVPIVANYSGVVTRIGVKNGMYITPGTEIFKIADLSSVWVIADVFEHQLTWVKVGNKALLRVQSMADKEWQGEVDYIYPELNPKTRTLKIRIKIDTPDQLLKPNMFADVKLLTNNKKVLSIPTESVIYYENSPRVVKVVGVNKYQPVEVTLGMKSNGQVEIIDGLDEGDDILVSGQFMIDSESNLQASFRRIMDK